MELSSVQVSRFVCALFVTAAAATAAPLQASTILDINSFSRMEPSGGGFVVATSQFSLASGDIPNVIFEANFSVIDAGIQINVNGSTLFATGDDVSNFGPPVFQSTAVQPDNIDFSFSPNNSGLPRLTVLSDATGSDFSGAPFVASTSTEDYIPLFTVNDFTSLLQTGNNVIEIVNLNSFQGANLVGDYTVSLPTSAPEPSALVLVFAGCCVLASRRRRGWS